MTITLVRPSFPEGENGTYPPYSLITIAPYIPNTVKICDLQTDGDIDSVNSPEVGFTCFSIQLPEVNRLAGYLKGKHRCKVLAGGPGVTTHPEYAKRILANADELVIGEGERYFYQDFDFCDSKRVPSWHLIDWERYRKSVGFAIETSRGCPFNCVFCSAHLVNGRIWRSRTPEDVVEEIKTLTATYKCRKYYFTDDNATVDPSRWANLMQQIVDAKLNLTIAVPEGIQAHHLDYETLSLMKKAGFEEIVIGAESGVQRVLDKVIDKGGLKLEQIENVVRDCKKLNIDVGCFFVIGTIGETLEEAKQTVEFAEKLRKLGSYSCSIRSALPVPGTRMFRIAKEKGYLTVPEEKLFDYEYLHSGKHFLSTPEWKAEEIESLVALAKEQDQSHVEHNRLKRKLKRKIMSHSTRILKGGWRWR